MGLIYDVHLGQLTSGVNVGSCALPNTPAVVHRFALGIGREWSCMPPHPSLAMLESPRVEGGIRNTMQEPW
jgi:hypothetical protein